MNKAPAISVLAHVHTVRRRLPAAAFVAAAVLAVGIPVAFRLPNLYRSSASLLVNQLPETLLPSGSVSDVDARLQAIKQDALSRTRLRELAAQFDLYPELRGKDAMDTVLDRLQKDVKIEITSTFEKYGRLSTVAFKISYVGTDPAVVAKVVNRLALFYVEKNDAIRAGGANRTADFLKEQLDSAKAQLDLKERAAIAFASRNAGALPAQMSSIVSKYGQLTQQLQIDATEQLRLIERRDALQTQIATLSTSKSNDADPGVKLRQAQEELESLRLRFTEGMPEVKDKKREIAALQSLVKQNDDAHGAVAATPTTLVTLQAQLQSTNQRLEQLRASNARIRASIRDYDALVGQAPQRDANFEKITREVQSMRELYDSLQKRYQNALLVERAEAGDGLEEFRVLDQAVPSTSPAAPNRRLLLGASAVLAVGLAICVVVLLEWFDESFGTLDDLRSFTRVPVLATIPVLAGSRDHGKRDQTLAISATALAVIGLIGFAALQTAPRAEFLTRMLLRSS